MADTKPKPKPADLNKDGEVTPAERRKYQQQKKANDAAAAAKPGVYEPAKDPLNESQLAQRYGFAKEIIWQNKELRGLYQKAIKEGWTPQQFDQQVRGSGWYKDNAEYARKAWAAERIGGADWSAQVEEARVKVQQRATALGTPVDDATLDKMALRYMREGWGESARAQFMDNALSERLSQSEGYLKGAAGSLQEELATVARRNGVKLSDGYYTSAAKSVASGLTTEDDWRREVREMAASRWPTYSDRIMGGLDMEDLASGYINTMAQVWEMDPSQIDLDNPFIKEALQGVDPATGQPVTESLWSFETKLKKDPRWQNTKNGSNQIADLGMDILRRMGFQS
jgi:hypothetical protein